MAALAHRFSLAYDHLLTRHRLFTTFVTGCVLGGLGDAAAQAGQSLSSANDYVAESVAGSDSYDLERGAAFTVFGGVLAGPMNYLWLQRLERLTERLTPRLGHLRTLVVKFCSHTLVFQPLIYLPTFYTVTALVRKWSPDDFVRHVREGFTSTLTRIWCAPQESPRPSCLA